MKVRDFRYWPLAPDHVLMANGRYRRRSGHVRASALTISVEIDPNKTWLPCPLTRASRGDLPWWRRGSEKWARLCLSVHWCGRREGTVPGAERWLDRSS